MIYTALCVILFLGALGMQASSNYGSETVFVSAFLLCLLAIATLGARAGMLTMETHANSGRPLALWHSVVRSIISLWIWTTMLLWCLRFIAWVSHEPLRPLSVAEVAGMLANHTTLLTVFWLELLVVGPLLFFYWNHERVQSSHSRST